MDQAAILAILEGRADLTVLGNRTIAAASSALQRSLPTMEHAVQLVDRLAAALGPQGWEDPDGALSRRIFARDPEDPEWLVPAPLLEHHFAAQDVEVHVSVPLPEGVALPPQSPPPAGGTPQVAPLDLVPRTSSMREGWLRLAEGRGEVLLGYRDDGQLVHYAITGGDPFTTVHHSTDRSFAIDLTARPPMPWPPSLLCRADLNPHGHAVDQLAGFVAAMEPWEEVRVRARLPAPIPYGPQMAWERVVGPLRRALWDGLIPETARHLVIDGYLGRALGWGQTLEEALARWTAEVERGEAPNPEQWNIRRLRAPGPTISEPARAVLPDGRSVAHLRIEVQLPSLPTGLPWPTAVADTPAIRLDLPPPPGAIPEGFLAAGFRRWVPLVGATGAVGHGLLRDDPTGCTIVGDGVLDAVDPGGLTAALDAFDATAAAPWDARSGQNPWRGGDRRAHYLVWDFVQRRPISPRMRPAARGVPPHPAVGLGDPAPLLDGDQVRWEVVRYVGPVAAATGP